MAVATGTIGRTLNWGSEHVDKDNNLIVREVSLQPPVMVLEKYCIKPACILKVYFRFLWEVIVYSLISTYHSRRVKYAETNRHKDILARYRTGEPSPTTFWQAIFNHVKLSCPYCRTKEFKDVWITRPLGKLNF